VANGAGQQDLALVAHTGGDGRVNPGAVDLDDVVPDPVDIGLQQADLPGIDFLFRVDVDNRIEIPWNLTQVENMFAKEFHYRSLLGAENRQKSVMLGAPAGEAQCA
jgi:hypothetical protein